MFVFGKRLIAKGRTELKGGDLTAVGTIFKPLRGDFLVRVLSIGGGGPITDLINGGGARQLVVNELFAFMRFELAKEFVIVVVAVVVVAVVVSGGGGGVVANEFVAIL